MQTIPTRIFSAMMQYLRGGGMSHIIPADIQQQLPKILNSCLYGDGQAKPKATHSAWLSEDSALKALHNCGYWQDAAPTSWPEPRIPDKAENDLINEVIMEMRRAKTKNPLPRQANPPETAWWRSKGVFSFNEMEEEQFKQFALRDLELDRKAGIETLVALSEAELQLAIAEGRRRYKKEGNKI